MIHMDTRYPRFSQKAEPETGLACRQFIWGRISGGGGGGNGNNKAEKEGNPIQWYIIKLVSSVGNCALTC